MNTLEITAVIITLNEEKIIRRCLNQLSWCNEIIVVDSGSSDNTVQICNELNATVMYRKFDGYGAQKQYAVSYATNDWILNVDADEIVSEDLKNEICIELSKKSTIFTAYSIPFRTCFMDTVLHFGPTSKESHVRLFNKKHCTFNNQEVHESVVFNGICGKLKGHIYHYSYDNLFDYFTKFNIYTGYQAEEYYRKQKKINKIIVPLKFVFSFIQSYFFKKGFLDGYPGFLYCLLHSLYTFIKYAKLIELREYKK